VTFVETTKHTVGTERCRRAVVLEENTNQFNNNHFNLQGFRLWEEEEEG